MSCFTDERRFFMESTKAKFHLPGFTIHAKFNLVFLKLYIFLTSIHLFPNISKMGYHFTIDSVSFPKAASGKLDLTLKIENVRDITRDAIIVGDEVYITATNKLLGNVVRVESEPHKTDAMTDEGVIYKTTIPERFDVTIVVETAGKKKPEGYFTSNNFHLYYGKSIEVKTSTIQTNPKICGITVIENAQ